MDVLAGLSGLLGCDPLRVQDILLSLWILHRWIRSCFPVRTHPGGYLLLNLLAVKTVIDNKKTNFDTEQP